MRVVHVVETLDVGGAEHMVVALARLQRERGHQVSIVCLFHEGALAAQAREAGIEVVACGKRPGLDLGALLRLRRRLGERRPEVVHTHNPTAHYYAVAAAAGRGSARMINTRHGMGSAAASARSALLYRLAVRFTDYGVSVCEAAQRSFVSERLIPPAKAVTVPNGIDLSRSRPCSAGARQRLLAELGVDGDPVVFGSVGRLNRLKDQAGMLRAFARLVRPEDGGAPAPAPARRAILVIAGDGEERGRLEQERSALGLDGLVFLLGQRGDVPDLLAGMDVFVLSSRTEGYSLALVEAAAAGLPIVATDVGGNAEIVAQDVTGLLVPAGDPQALARALEALSDDPGLRARMGEAARRWALEHGSIDSMYRHYLWLYQGRPVDTPAIDKEMHA